MAWAPDKPRLVNTLIQQFGQRLIDAGQEADAPTLQRWRADPVAWAEEVLKVPRHTLEWSRNPGYEKHTWDGTPDPIASLLRGLVTHRRVGAESAVGTGKTFSLGIAVKWFLACYPGGTVVTIAPKKDQLKLHLWKEINRSWRHFQTLYPLAELTDLRIRMTPGSDVWAAHGFPVGVSADEESATKAQGFHDEHMLIIVEETPGVHHAVMTALLNTAVDDHNLVLAVGNPDHQLDTLHDFCVNTPGCLHVRISALDHPNIVSKAGIIRGAVSQVSIDEKKARYGGVEMPMFRSRVRGISPTESHDSLIKLAWCYAARDRGRALVASMWPKDPNAKLDYLVGGSPLNQAMRNLPLALGVDVANSADGDRGAIARGRGHILAKLESFPCPDANALGRRLVVELKSLGIDPNKIGVDGVGVGVGTVNEFKHAGFPVQNLIGGALPYDKETMPQLGEELFKNLRSQIYWLLRHDLQHGNIILPDDETLFQDLIITKFEVKDKAIVVESKETLKKRLGRSPDKGDAVAYWNWVRQIQGRTSWGKVKAGF